MTDESKTASSCRVLVVLVVLTDFVSNACAIRTCLKSMRRMQFDFNFGLDKSLNWFVQKVIKVD